MHENVMKTIAEPLRGPLSHKGYDPELLYVECSQCGSPVMWEKGKATDILGVAGIDPLEFRFHAMVDRLNTTGTAWLGLTLVCASCHTHKFDPIPQTEYYRMFALLNNADEPEIDIARDIEEHVFLELCQLFDRDLSLVFCDLTSTCFEGEGPERCCLRLLARQVRGPEADRHRCGRGSARATNQSLDLPG